MWAVPLCFYYNNVAVDKSFERSDGGHKTRVAINFDDASSKWLVVGFAKLETL